MKEDIPNTEATGFAGTEADNAGKLSITQWAEEDRPREKLMQKGAQALSNAELLAILIGSGSTKETAVELMRHVLKDCNNNLNTLGKKSIRELCEYNRSDYGSCFLSGNLAQPV